MHHVANHLFHILRHPDRQETNIGVLVLEHDKQLMREALPDPVQSGKIESHLPETIQTTAKPLGLRPRYRA